MALSIEEIKQAVEDILSDNPVVPLWAYILLVTLPIIGTFLGSYFSAKAKNLATKEDIEDLTNIVETVKSDYQKTLEEYKKELGHKYDIYKLISETKIELYKKSTVLIQKIHRHANNINTHKELMDEIFSEVPIFLIELNSYEFIHKKYLTEIASIQNEYNNIITIVENARDSESQRYEFSYNALIKSFEVLQSSLLS